MILCLVWGDSAFGLESWISSPHFVDRRSSLISLCGSKSPDSSPKILESLELILESVFGDLAKVDSSAAWLFSLGF
ncbi:hypothetical protein [Helicobacter canis]|uniref:hypothetical protein n=1 Tax=Helicobacter canis TaxID=29419 RepID=UPI002942997C|nr:hypothetical protein [Helicobacter canis]